MSTGNDCPIRVSYALFLDDERQPPQGEWVIVRSYDEAVRYVTQHGMPTKISFDHDLGEAKSGQDFARWLVDHHFIQPLPDDFSFVVHSRNPVGAENITALLNRFLLYIGR